MTASRAFFFFLLVCAAERGLSTTQVDSVEIYFELILQGTDPAELDASNLNGTQIVEQLNKLARDNPDDFERLTGALMGTVLPVYSADAVEVSLCGVGSFINSTSGRCTPCPAGTYSITPLSTSAGDCRPCIAGTYSGLLGASNASACVSCGTGTYSTVTGATSADVCQGCGSGATSVAGAQGSGACVCISGYYRAGGGNCVPCEEGHYCSGDVRVACPGFADGKSTSPPQSTAVEQCLCKPGFYGWAYYGSGCLDCLPDHYCNGDQDSGNYGRLYSCPTNSYSPLNSASLDACTCGTSYRKQFSMVAARSVLVTAEPCNCTLARSPPTCSSVDVPGCVTCASRESCVRPVLTCKQGYLDIVGLSGTGTRTWTLAPAGAERVRATITKFVASSGSNWLKVEQCTNANCTMKNSLLTLSGTPTQQYFTVATAADYKVLLVTWFAASSVSSPLEMQYNSEIPCQKTDVAVTAGAVQFLDTSETILSPFQPPSGWPLVMWLGDVMTFTLNAVQLDLREGSAAGASLSDPILGLNQFIPTAVGTYWLVDVEYPTRTKQIFVAPVDSRKVQVWYTATTGTGASFTLSGDVAGTGSPDVVLVVRDVLTMGRLTTAHGLVLMSSYANATAWTALDGAGVSGQSVAGMTTWETSVTWDTREYEPGVYYYGSVGSMGSVKVGRIILYPPSGGASCAACLEGEYCYDGNAARCPANAQSPAGSDDVGDCKCKPGFAVSSTDLESYVNSQTVDCGSRHSCVVAQNGSLWCWGANDKGQLGRGVISASEAVPREVPGLSHVRNVSLGSDFTCAVVGANLRVVCWGGNEYGQLGLDSSALTQASPGAEAKLGGGSAAYETRNLACAGQSCCAIVFKAGGVETLTCWGRSNYGQLGKGVGVLYGTKNVGTGITVTSDPRYSYASTGDSVSLGLHVASSVTMAVEHACAVTTQGAVLCWGLNNYGALGQGRSETGIFNPSVVDVGGPVKAVNCYAFVCCAVMAETFQVKCWGRGSGGRLGVGMFDVGVTPQSMGASMLSVNLGKDALVMDVNVGETQVCALLLNNFVKCWGTVKGVVLGDNPPVDAMSLLPDLEMADSRVALQIGGKGSTMCAVLSDYRVVCWGTNTTGQLGGPVVVSSLSLAVASLPAGVSALRSSGTPTVLSCMVCEANTYCAGEGGLPERCPANTQSPVMSTKAEECVCVAGYKRGGGGVCVQCSGREYCAVGQAFECPLNSATEAPGSSQLSACKCDRGYYYGGVNLGCVPCQRGTYKDAVGNAGSCAACPAGTRSGAMALGNASGCEACPGGSYSDAGSEFCFACGPGTAAAPGSSRCVRCGAGFFAVANASACTACAAGTYDDVPRDGTPGTCFPCPSGKFSDVLNATEDVCRDCSAGFFSGPASGRCTPCDPGTYSPQGAVSCTACPGNATSVNGSAYGACRCLAGFYKRFSPGGATFSCERCGPGEFSGFDTENACGKCPAGKASAALGAVDVSLCAPCVRGTYSWPGAASCSPCSVGFVSGADGATNCSECLLGYWAASGSSVCVECGPGKYAPGRGLGSAEQCLPCPRGSFCVGAVNAYGQGRALVEECPLGTFQNLTGQSLSTQCKPCPANFFCPTPTLRGACPEGTQSLPSSVSQLQCECKTGFTCNYNKVVNAVVTLFMTKAEFEDNPDVQRAFREAVALAAKTTWDKVRITKIMSVQGSTGRRLLGARRSKGVHVALEIEGGDGTGAGLGAELDARLGEVGLEIEEERGWIAPHDVIVRALV